jgi:hypothetical protein
MDYLPLHRPAITQELSEMLTDQFRNLGQLRDDLLYEPLARKPHLRAVQPIGPGAAA